jgi:hypothetical protein
VGGDLREGLFAVDDVGVLGVRIEQIGLVRGRGAVGAGRPDDHRAETVLRASSAQARTQPLVEKPPMTSVSIRCAASQAASGVPAKALA